MFTCSELRKQVHLLQPIASESVNIILTNSAVWTTESRSTGATVAVCHIYAVSRIQAGSGYALIEVCELQNKTIIQPGLFLQITAQFFSQEK